MTDPLAGYRWSNRIVERVLTEEGVLDRDALLKEAVKVDDGNQYLKTSELRDAAQVLLGQTSGSQQTPRGYRWSTSVLARVMAGHNLHDESALLAEAVHHDDGNKYLKKSELQSAAVRLAGPEIGIISDLDKTVIPAHRGALPNAAHAGVATLFRELEYRRGGQRGDVHYVTARSPDRVETIPRWLKKHAVPQGPISTGTSPVP